MAICIRRREFVVTLSGAAAVSALGKIARTETYPARPVRIVVAQAPGSGSDIAAPGTKKRNPAQASGRGLSYWDSRRGSGGVFGRPTP